MATGPGAGAGATKGSMSVGEHGLGNGVRDRSRECDTGPVVGAGVIKGSRRVGVQGSGYGVRGW